MSKRHQIPNFLIVIISASRTCNFFFFEFLVSVINHYHINGLHLFWDSFEWFCLQISSNTKYFFLFCPRHCDRGLIVVIIYHLHDPVHWGCRIHRLHLCWRVRLLQQVSWYETKQFGALENAGALGNAEYLFIDIALRSTLIQSGSTT